jgi:hypothetical protein
MTDYGNESGGQQSGARYPPRCHRNWQARARSGDFPDCPGIAVLNLAALPVILAFITAVSGFLG